VEEPEKLLLGGATPGDSISMSYSNRLRLIKIDAGKFGQKLLHGVKILSPLIFNPFQGQSLGKIKATTAGTL